MEIATAIGGALLSASFDKLFDKLASPDLRQLTRKKKVHSQLEMWEKSLLPKIYAVLEDAEDKKTTSRLVGIWLRELRDLVYDLEDVLDEFATEALRVKLKIKQQAAVAATATSSTNKVRKFLPSLRIIGSSSSGGGNFNYAEIGYKLENITTRLEKICTEKNNLELGDKAVGGRSNNKTTYQRVPTTSLPDSHVLGRDKDMEAILDLLLAGEQSAAAAGVSVIPIQGMGGLGKTTLAQQLYNDEKVKFHFDLRAWVCVSDTFDIPSITKTILQSIGGGTTDGMTLDQLQISLGNILSGKKFFIVLDDVWNEKYEDWTILYKPFKTGAPESKIIVTTRNQEVATMMGSVETYGLMELKYDDCLSLFTWHALGATNFDEHPDLKDIGQMIVKKCKGLPLTAKTLGGLLRTKLNRDEWVDVLKSKIWDLPEKKSDILPALRLSYHHLPSHLKQCFAYCAIFPKDFNFNINELVLLWMAEGFLSQPNGGKNMADVGVAYFYDLLSRSFFQQSSRDGASFVMHDLIHDLALCTAGEICFSLNGHLEIDEHLSTFQKVRHLSFFRSNYVVSERFAVFDEGKGLRTLLPLPGLASNHYSCLSNEVLRKIFKLKYLRVLSLSGYTLRYVPEPVNGLKHLRYLNLSKTEITLLPDFVSSLLNLQTLSLRECKKLEKLPTGIGNLTNLYHLDISGTDQLKAMPVGIGNLTDLRALSKFIVGVRGVDGLNIRELKDLSHLKGEVSIEGLHNVKDLQDARDANMKGKPGLETLVMAWNSDSDDLVSNGSVARDVLELLQPHRDLKRLVIQFYCGREFPSWMGDPSLMSNMVELELCNCWKSTSLPSPGRLPVLKHLVIKGMNAIKILGIEFYGCDSAFIALETLKFEDMLGWEQWLQGKFLCLRELVIRNCPLLVGEFPISLPSLCKLKLEKCSESLLRCMVDLVSLKTLSMGKVSGIFCLDESVVRSLVALENLEIYECEDLKSLWQNGAQVEEKLACLRSLKVRSCPQLVSLSCEMPRDLLSLEIVSCVNLQKLPKKMMSLEKIFIQECPKIGSVQIEHEGNDEIGFPWKLKHVELEDCGDQLTKSLVDGILTRGPECLLEHLKIKSYDSLQQLSITKEDNAVPALLKQLIIQDSENLVSLSNMWSLSSSLTVIEKIEIKDCPNLKSLPDCLHSLTNLKSLKLLNCNSIGCFPEGGLPVPNLEFLNITKCRNLKSLPNNMHSLTSLQTLYIWDCSSVQSFPEMGLPPNLLTVFIMDCPNMKQSMSEWSLHSLTSLRVLWIGVPVPEDEPTLRSSLLLPTTLQELTIFGFKKLESISSSSWGIQNLSSLTSLYLMDCPNLQCLPNEGLPSTLEILEIQNCPMLFKKYSKRKGKYWPLVS